MDTVGLGEKMKSIEKLKSVVLDIRRTVSSAIASDYGTGNGNITDYDVRRALGKAIDEIEQEIEERYIELPVDSNDVPIKLGDRLTDGEYTFVADYIEFYDGQYTICDENGVAWACCDVEHVPDTAKQLKPCPFCGSSDLYIVEQVIGREAPFGSADDKTVGIFCNACKQTVTLEANEDEGRSISTEQRAVEAWNMRAAWNRRAK